MLQPEFVEHITAFVEKEINVKSEHRPLFERMLMLNWAIRDAHATHGKDSKEFAAAVNILEGYHYCMQGMGYPKKSLLLIEEWYTLWQLKKANNPNYAQRLELAHRHGYNFAAIVHQPPGQS